MSPRRQSLLVAALCLIGCSGGPDASPESGSETATPAAPPPPEWKEPLPTLLAGSVDEADVMELAPQLSELVPTRGANDSVELARFKPGPLERTPLGGGWEGLDFSLSGSGRFSEFLQTLELIDKGCRRLIHTRRAECRRSGDTLEWSVDARAYAQTSALQDPAGVRTALRRTAWLADRYTPRSWELGQLRAVTNDLQALWFEGLAFQGSAITVEGRAEEPELPRTLLARLQAAPYSNRYTVRLEQSGSAFSLTLERVAEPALPPFDSVPAALRKTYAPALEEGREAFRSEFSRVREGAGLDERLAAARWLESKDEGHLAAELLLSGLESAEGERWAEGLLAFAHLELPKATFGLPKAKDLLLLAQSLQWPMFSEIAHDDAFAVLRDDPTYLLDLLLADRDPRMAASRRDPFQLPPPPPPPPNPAEEELMKKLRKLLQEVVSLIDEGIEDEARSRVDDYKDVLAELEALDPAAAQPWKSRLDDLGSFGR